jgi:moderate conductance mechanosensitive channel
MGMGVFNGLYKRVRRWLVWGVVVFGVGLGAIAFHPPAAAQFSLETPSESNISSPPERVSRFGSIEVAPVYSPLDGGELFTIASPTVYDRSNPDPSAVFPVEQRAEEINVRLWRIIRRRMNPATLAVSVSRLNNVTIIRAEDDAYSRPLILVSVTELDADYHGLPIEVLAEEWRGILEQEIRDGIRMLSPEELLRSLRRSGAILLGLGGLTIAILLVKAAIRRRQRTLKRQKKAMVAQADQSSVQATALEAPALLTPEALAGHRAAFLARMWQVFPIERRLSLYGFIQWLLFWVVILLWFLGLFWSANQIPVLMRWSGGIIGKPIELLVVWFLAGLVLRISHRLIDQLTAAWRDSDFLNWGDTQRRLLRTSTIAGAAKGFVTVAIGGTALLTVLNILGVPTASVLAIGGLVGLAISFGAQNLVKDLVNGCLILAEDQYAIGDVIDLGNVSGLVENLNLRVTQLRNTNGELITVPNSAIAAVKNLTRDWSQVNFSIDVAYQSDPEQALATLRQVAQALYDDPDWHNKILSAPEVLGIDSVSHSGMTITTWIRTAPAQQWAVGREFRLRVRKALEASGIEIGAPMQTYAEESAALPRQPRQPHNGSTV